MNTLNLNDFANVVIIRCRITGIPGVTKQDKVRTQELATTTGANKGHGRVTKTLFASSKRATDLKKIGASVRNWIRVVSLPGEIDGKYMIPAFRFQEFQTKLDNWRDEYLTILADFCANLDAEVAADMRAKRNLFDAEDYPTVDEVEASARFDWGFEPLPDSSKFADIFDSDEIVRAMQEQHDTHITELFATATEVNLERMTGRVSAVLGQLKRYTGASGQRLHCEGIVDGMTETAKTADGLNVSNSSEVADLAAAMISWSDEYTPCETLKNDIVRGKAITELGRMLPTVEPVAPAPAGWESVGTSVPDEEKTSEGVLDETQPAMATVSVDALSVDMLDF